MFKWSRRAWVYLVKPQTLLGGIVAFGIVQGVDLYKEYEASQDAEVSSARDKLATEIRNLPTTSAALGSVVENVRGLYQLYDSKRAREKISHKVGELENLLALKREEEKKEGEREAALRAEAEARKRQDAKAAEEARLQAQKKAAEARALAKRVAEASRTVSSFPRVRF